MTARARGAGRGSVKREGAELEVEEGRDAERGLSEVGGVEMGREEEAVRAGGRDGDERDVAGRSVVERVLLGRGALELEEAGRDLGRGGDTNEGTSKSSLKGSKGSRGALRRGIECGEWQQISSSCGTKIPFTFYQWFLRSGCS